MTTNSMSDEFPNATRLRFLGLVPIEISPSEWEGKPTLWRSASNAPIEIRTIPVAFNRLSYNTGTIEVAVIGDPLAKIPDAIVTAVNERDALRAALKDARDNGLTYWEPNTSRGHISKAEMIARIDAILNAK